MISRLFLTITLASSLSLTAAQEKKQPAFIDPQQTYAKTFTQLTVAASVLTMCAGIYNLNMAITSCGFGLLTGLGCAAYETKTDCSIVKSWISEMVVRYSFVNGIVNFPNTRAFYNANVASEAGSWTGYLGYCVASAMDKE